MASAMNSISVGCSSFFSAESSFINSSSMCRRPAVSTITTSLAESFASLIAPRTISSGLSVPVAGQTEMPIDFATCASCSRAAGRYTSVETTIGRWPCCESHFASLPVVVVLPEPCRPTIIHTEGGRDANSGLACLPRRLVNSSRTIFTTCWSGESCNITSVPSALARMLASNSSATATFTSPSSSASRISASAASRCSSESFPCPRRFLNVRCSRSVRFSNMFGSCPYLYYCTASRAGLQQGTRNALTNCTLDMLQVSVLKVRRILQTKTQRTIEADVCQPDQRIRRDLRESGKIANEEQSYRPNGRMHQVEETVPHFTLIRYPIIKR